MPPVLTVAVLLPWLLIALLGWLVYLLVRQHGRALLQQDELRERQAAAERTLQELVGQVAALRQGAPALQAPAAAPERPGLPLGSPAPAFTLPDLSGTPRRLADFLGRPLLLVFFNTGCGFCLQMAPRLGQLAADGPRVLLVGNGDPADYRRLAAEHGWRCDILIDTAGTTMATYRANGTPMGYLLDAQGRIASDLAAGADALLNLLGAPAGGPAANGHANGHAADLTPDSLRAKEQAAAERARAAGLLVRESTLNRQGLPAGTKAPDFRLPDLAGRTRSLNQFRGRPVLLVFSDPECGPCQALAPRLAELQAQQGERLQVVMIGRGDPAANRAKAEEHGLTFPVLLQKRWEVSKEYAMFATPIAYLIDERGIISQDVAVGGDAILQLAQGVPA